MARDPAMAPPSLDAEQAAGYGLVAGRSLLGRRTVDLWCRRTIGLALLLLAGGAQAQTLDRVRDSGTFRIGYREDAAPFSYEDALGEAAGYSVELCRAVAANVSTVLGLAEIAVEYVPVTTEDRFQAVQDGRVDILCGATTVTLSRRKLVDFSLLTFIDGAGVMLRRDGPEDFEGLAGLKVGVRRATTTEAALADALAQQGLAVEVVSVASHEDGLAKLQAGEIQAYFGDRAILTYLLLGSGSDDLWVSERQFSYEPYALALTRGDDDFRLLVDATLSELYTSGAIERIFTATFGARAEPTDMLQALYVINRLPE
jgi:ABC-type amino acid transport substrate-binding protein